MLSEKNKAIKGWTLHFGFFTKPTQTSKWLISYIHLKNSLSSQHRRNKNELSHLWIVSRLEYSISAAAGSSWVVSSESLSTLPYTFWSSNWDWVSATQPPLLHMLLYITSFSSSPSCADSDVTTTCLGSDVFACLTAGFSNVKYWSSDLHAVPESPAGKIETVALYKLWIEWAGNRG